MREVQFPVLVLASAGIVRKARPPLEMVLRRVRAVLMALSVLEDPHPHLVRRGTTARMASRRPPALKGHTTLESLAALRLIV